MDFKKVARSISKDLYKEGIISLDQRNMIDNLVFGVLTIENIDEDPWGKLCKQCECRITVSEHWPQILTGYDEYSFDFKLFFCSEEHLREYLQSKVTLEDCKNGNGHRQQDSCKGYVSK